MVEILLLKNVVKYQSNIQHIAEIFLFCYLIWFDMCHWLCIPGLFFSGTYIVQGFDMKLLEKKKLSVRFHLDSSSRDGIIFASSSVKLMIMSSKYFVYYYEIVF